MGGDSYQDNFEKFRTFDFFQFFERYGITWFHVEGMPRKKDGERGAPVGDRFGFRYAVHTEKITDAFRRFDFTMKRHGKSRVDLQTRESPDRNRGSRVILLDDLQEHRIDDLMRWWCGPMAIIETSQMCFQALLVSSRGLSDPEVLRCQTAAVSMFETDAASTSARKLHRFPGSPNYKASCLVKGAPFFCRTLCLIEGEGDGAEGVEELLGEEADMEAIEVPIVALPSANTSRKNPKNANGGSGNSEQAMSWALAQLRAGIDSQMILNGLSTAYLSHHSSSDWPRRTLHNARHYLGMEPTRYRAK